MCNQGNINSEKDAPRVCAHGFQCRVVQGVGTKRMYPDCTTSTQISRNHIEFDLISGN